MFEFQINSLISHQISRGGANEKMGSGLMIYPFCFLTVSQGGRKDGEEGSEGTKNPAPLSMCLT